MTYSVRKIESASQAWECFEVVDERGQVVAKTGQNETWCIPPAVPELLAWRIMMLLNFADGVPNEKLENALTKTYFVRRSNSEAV